MKFGSSARLDATSSTLTNTLKSLVRTPSRVTLLGSTGSIGTQAIQVIEHLARLAGITVDAEDAPLKVAARNGILDKSLSDVKVLLAIALLLVGLAVKAQDEPVRTFTIDGQIGGASSPHVKTISKGQYLIPEKVGSGYGMISKLRVEYYLPYTPFSLKAGYEQLRDRKSVV